MPTAPILEAQGFEPQIYNSLPSVDHAFQILQMRPRWDALIRQGLQIIAKHKLCDNVAIFLLHRHFNIDEAGVLLERGRKDKRWGYVYATSRNPISVLAQETAVPWRFMLQGNNSGKMDYIALEFSTELRLWPSLRALANKPQFQEQFARFLLETASINQLGLALMPCKRTRKPDPRALLEETNVVSKESVVRRVNPSLVPQGSVIPTMWVCAGADGCCSPSSYCKAYCYRAGDEPHDPSHAVVGDGHIGCV